MRCLKYFFASVLVVALVSCDAITGDPDLPIPLEETMENTGGFVRVLSVESPVFDGANIGESQFSFVGEVADNENGGLSESVTFYATYVDFERNRLEETPALATIQVSDLEVSEESGLPRGTFTLPLADILDAYGDQLNADDLNGGDRFDVRWELTMKDGRTFSSNDVSQSVTGGFYDSPFAARVNVVIAVPKDMFVGEYTFEQLDPAPTVGWASQFVSGDPNSEGWIWQSQSSPGSFTATLSVDPQNDLQGRIFTATYLEEWGFSPSDHAIEIGLFNPTTPLYITMGRDTDNGLGCGGGNIAVGSDRTAGEFDPADDSEFELVVVDNVRGDCGQPTTNVRFKVTKN